MIDLLTENRIEIAELCESHGVHKHEVFGSAVTGNFDPDRSDIDLIVEFFDESPGLARHYLSFAEALETLFGRPVDLIIDKPFKNPYFRSKVNKTRTTIYARTDRKAAA